MSTTAPAPVEGGPGAPAAAALGPESLGDYLRRWWVGVKSGELGSLPIVVGLILIAIVFQSQNSNFLTAGNFVNLIVQAAAFATIGMGIVFVLLLGEIDLSVGYVSGVAGVLVALLTFPDNHNVFAAGPALVLALAAGLGIGLLHGLIITKLGVPPKPEPQRAETGLPSFVLLTNPSRIGEGRPSGSTPHRVAGVPT